MATGDPGRPHMSDWLLEKFQLSALPISVGHLSPWDRALLDRLNRSHVFPIGQMLFVLRH